MTLLAPKGLELDFKLAVGDVSVRLSHTFNEDAPSCTTKRMCNIVDQINCEEDTLRLYFEVIEAISAVDCTANEQTRLSDAILESSSMFTHRYLHHGTLEMVQEEVKKMRSRMTRRIEWKVEQASMLQQCFPAGVSICSPTFLAAGLDGLQLVFFPS